MTTSPPKGKTKNKFDCHVERKSYPMLGDIVEFKGMLWKVISTINNVVTIENDGWSCSYSVLDIDKNNKKIFSVANNTKQITKPINTRKLYDYEVSEVKKFKQTLQGEVIGFIRPILLKLD